MNIIKITIFPFLFTLLLFSRTHAQVSRDSLLNNLNTLLNANTPEAKEKLMLEAKKLKLSNTEENLILAHKIYKELGEENHHNELRKTILIKYPNGITSRQQAADEFLKQMDQQTPQWIEKHYLLWLKKFPIENFEPKNRGSYDMVLMQIIKHYVSIGQYDLVDKYKNTFIDSSLKIMSYYAIAENYFKQNNLQQSKTHIDSALMWSDQARQSTDMKVRSGFGALMYNNIALLTAQVDLKYGNPQTAIRLLPDILNKTNYQPMHGETMIFTLAQAYQMIGANLEAFRELKSYITNNEEVDNVWSEIEGLYKRLNSQEGNFAQLKTDIENEKDIKYIQILKEKVVKKEIPNFELRNLDGKIVKLKDYKGKIVILDFWATWCVPCVRSFPAMQQLVEEYRNNNEVEFLFINTWEKQKNFKQAVQDLITSNNYTFNVLFDEVSQKNDLLLSSQLGVPSLPTKILVDKDGFLRLMISGSETNHKAIIKEVKNLIKIGQEFK